MTFSDSVSENVSSGTDSWLSVGSSWPLSGGSMGYASSVFIEDARPIAPSHQPSAISDDRFSGKFDFFRKSAAVLMVTTGVAAGVFGAVQQPSQPAQSIAASPTQNLSERDVERVALLRGELLEAKYSGGAVSRELLARLDILDRQMLELAPRVSTSQLEFLEYVQEKLRASQAMSRERADRLGLRAPA